MANIFFQGTLHEAIAYSMQNNLHFAALIIDEASEAAPENKIWEDEYLRDEGLAKLLKERTILYRIVAESTEALNLYAFLPKPEKLPCLVIIKSGTAQVESLGIADGNKTLEDIREWVRKTVVGDASQVPAHAQPIASVPATQTPPQERPPATAPQQVTPPPQIYDPPTSESAESASAKDKGKAKATSSDSASSAKTGQDREQARREAHLTQQAAKNSNLGFIAEQRKRAQEADVEKQRVKKLLEEDKAMRAAKEREAKEARERERSGTATPGQGLRPTGAGAGADSKECALSFRLLDGSALKHKFSADVKLGVEVRKWIDQNRPDETDRPYTFTQILTPFPNKHISLSEENTTLKALGLTPSATLVLIPSNTSQASAYPSLGGIPSPWGLVSALSSGVSSVLGTGYNAVTGVVAAVTGGAGDHQRSPQTGQVGTNTTPDRSGVGLPRPSRGNGGTRIRTIHDGNGQGGEGRSVGNKFYNGNQLNFEPNQDGK